MSSTSERARELLAGITPAEWRAVASGEEKRCWYVREGDDAIALLKPTGRDGHLRQARAEFIAAAPQLVRDLLAELDQAQLGRDMWGRTADTLGGNLEDVGHILSGVRYDEAEDVYRAANRVVAERDAALATLREVRELCEMRACQAGTRTLAVELLAVLDRGPR